MAQEALRSITERGRVMLDRWLWTFARCTFFLCSYHFFQFPSHSCVCCACVHECVCTYLLWVLGVTQSASSTESRTNKSTDKIMIVFSTVILFHWKVQISRTSCKIFILIVKKINILRIIKLTCEFCLQTGTTTQTYTAVEVTALNREDDQHCAQTLQYTVDSSVDILLTVEYVTTAGRGLMLSQCLLKVTVE